MCCSEETTHSSVKKNAKEKINIFFVMFYFLQRPTRIMMRMAKTPDVAMILAQLGMRLKRTGTMASAPWSNLFPSTVESWLQERVAVKNTVKMQIQPSVSFPACLKKKKINNTHATVMHASRTTCERRSLADSLKAPSSSRRCWKKQS